MTRPRLVVVLGGAVVTIATASLTALMLHSGGVKPSDSSTANRPSVMIPIAPLRAELPGGTLAAVAEMVLRYYDVPKVHPVIAWQKASLGSVGGFLPPISYQCSIVGVMSHLCSIDCRACDLLPTDVRSMVEVLHRYAAISHELVGQGTPGLLLKPRLGGLSSEEILGEINRERPIVILLKAPKAPRFALVVGYRDSNPLSLVINDPSDGDDARQGPKEETPNLQIVVTRASIEHSWIGTIRILE